MGDRVKLLENPKYVLDSDGYVIGYRKNRALKPLIDANGYRKVRLYSDIKHWKDYYVHRLIAKYFIGLDESMDVIHIDGNKSNNSVSNLKVVHISDRLKHYHNNGAYSQSREFRKVKVCRLNDDGEILQIYDSIASAAKWISSEINQNLDTTNIARKIRYNISKTTKPISVFGVYWKKY